MKSVKVGVLANRQADWEIMRHTLDMLKSFGIESCTATARVNAIAKAAVKFQDVGATIIIVGESSASSGARVAATATIPVLVVPLQLASRRGAVPLFEVAAYDMAPAGFLAIGVAGAKNAALSAVSILALSHPALARKYQAFRKKQTDTVLKSKVG